MTDNEKCTTCDAAASLRVCVRCGYTATVIDCGHYAQPAEVAASAHAGGRPVCATCAALAGGRVSDDALYALLGEVVAADPPSAPIVRLALRGDAAAIETCIEWITDARAAREVGWNLACPDDAGEGR